MNTLFQITQRLLPVRIIARGPWQAATFGSHDLAHQLSVDVDYGSVAEYRLTDRNCHVIEVCATCLEGFRRPSLRHTTKHTHRRRVAMTTCRYTSCITC